MNSVKRVLAVIVMLSFLIAPLCYAEYKICTIDLLRVFEEYQKRKDFDAQLETLRKEKEGQRNKLIDQLKEIQDKMSVLSDSEKAKKQNELSVKSKELQELDQKIRIDLRKDWDEKLRDVLDDIKKVVEDFSKKEGFTFAIDNKALLYSAQETDVTEQIIKILNSKYKK
ncbi:MAG: OmpH family outer membrane protein [Candidatus Omnitrophota bacterium]